MAEFGSVLLCERHIQEIEAREERENETLSQLLRYARLEARTERDYARKALERAVRAGRYEPPR